MHKNILEYLETHGGALDSEEAVIIWWQGLQEVMPDLDLLTEALEHLEDQEVIEKQVVENELFIYRIMSKV